MFMTPEEIDASTHWLLENASPPVKYLTHKHILKTDPDSEPMRALWERVADGSEADEVFSKQEEDGSWFSGGPWGPRGYRRQTGRGYTSSRPKFVTTAWILPYLGEMGFTAGDARVRKGCASMFEDLHYPAVDPATLSGEVNCCGLFAIPLRALASVGLASDARLQGGWEWLLRCQRSDGGWLNPNHLADSNTPSKTKGRWPWDRSCAWGSTFAAQALFYSDDPRHRRALHAALDFLLWHLGRQDPAYIRTWVYHGHNTVKELLMASEAGIDIGTPPIPALLDWLKGYYRPSEGVFRTQDQPIPAFARHVGAIVKDYATQYGGGYWDKVAKTGASVLRYHLYHLVEDDWLTYTATRIAVALG